MFSVFPLDFEGLETENNQLYVYGDSSLTLSTNQGVTNIALSKGAIFLKMAAPADITEVVFPNHGDATAKVIGGSVLLALDAETISFWCVSEECQLDFYDQTLHLSEKQVQVYQRFADSVAEAEEYEASPERQEEYNLWNNKCDLCMPFEPTGDGFVPSPVFTSQPTSYNPIEPTHAPTKTPTHTPTKTGTPTATKSSAPTKYTLTVRTEGQGSVSPNGGSYDAGARVTLIANPADGWEFTGWSGDASGTSSTVTLTITKNMTVKATFTKKAPVMYTLTVATEGQGSVSPYGGTYEAGTSVTLIASPADGWEFVGWSGDASGTSSTVTITITKNMTVRATFTKKAPVYYTLTVNISGQGSVYPSSGTYEEGTPVTLTASANYNWAFSRWGGDASGTSRTITITMSRNMNVTAYFYSTYPAPPKNQAKDQHIYWCWSLVHHWV